MNTVRVKLSTQVLVVAGGILLSSIAVGASASWLSSSQQTQKYSPPYVILAKKYVEDIKAEEQEKTRDTAIAGIAD